MNRRKTNVLSFIPPLLCVTFALAGKAESLGLQSTPTLEILAYSFQGLPPWTLPGAEVEVSRIFEPARLRLKWIDCTSGTAPAACTSLQAPSELIIRLVPNALPPASATALAMTLRSPDHGVAFIFYNRIVALQTSTSLLQIMLGRVVAHEITHLLLPEEEHSSSGLMRAHWKPDNLRFTSTACLGLSNRAIQLMYREALRRTQVNNDVVGK